MQGLRVFQSRFPNLSARGEERRLAGLVQQVAKGGGEEQEDEDDEIAGINKKCIHEK
jgi:hypothetical protein